MRRGSILGFLIGFISGVISAYILKKKKKQIMEKLNNLEEKIKKLELSKVVSANASEGITSLKKVTDKVEEVTDKEKEILLNKVEEKIRKLEEIIR